MPVMKNHNVHKMRPRLWDGKGEENFFRVCVDSPTLDSYMSSRRVLFLAFFLHFSGERYAGIYIFELLFINLGMRNIRIRPIME